MTMPAPTHETLLTEPLALDCFSVADWKTHYNLTLTPDQVAAVGNFPWSEATLNSPCPFHPGKRVRETHFAFVGLDTVTIMELQRLNPKATEPRFYAYGSDAWYAKQKFATKTTLAPRWYLLLKDIVPGSESKTFGEQEAMLPTGYEVPSAVAETAKDLFVFKKTGAYVNPNRCARTADLVSVGFRVLVGGCGADGVSILSYGGDNRTTLTWVSVPPGSSTRVLPLEPSYLLFPFPLEPSARFARRGLFLFPAHQKLVTPRD